MAWLVNYFGIPTVFPNVAAATKYFPLFNNVIENAKLKDKKNGKSKMAQLLEWEKKKQDILFTGGTATARPNLYLEMTEDTMDDTIPALILGDPVDETTEVDGAEDMTTIMNEDHDLSYWKNTWAHLHGCIADKSTATLLRDTVLGEHTKGIAKKSSHCHQYEFVSRKAEVVCAYAEYQILLKEQPCHWLHGVLEHLDIQDKKLVAKPCDTHDGPCTQDTKCIIRKPY